MMRALSCAVAGSEDSVGGISGIRGMEEDADAVLVVLDVVVPDDDGDDDDDGREEDREDGEEDEEEELDEPFPLDFPVAAGGVGAAVFLTVERGDLGDDVGGSSGLTAGMGCGFARMAS